jgi:hypothetical protein
MVNKEPPAFSQPTPSVEELAKALNTAMVATKLESARDYSTELVQLMETPAFRAFLQALRTLAATEGLTEKRAAEQLIQTFRRLDRLWTDYVLHEGVDRLRGGSQPTHPSN